jgi:hypothetical protein
LISFTDQFFKLYGIVIVIVKNYLTLPLQGLRRYLDRRTCSARR